MTLPFRLTNLGTGNRATEAVLDEVERTLGSPLPRDYRAFLMETDGLEGFLNEEEYLILWSSEDLVEMNEGYAVAEFAPGVTLVGTDGGGNGYGLTSKGGSTVYVSVPFVGMSLDTVHIIGQTLEEFLDRVALGLGLPK